MCFPESEKSGQNNEKKLIYLALVSFEHLEKTIVYDILI